MKALEAHVVVEHRIAGRRAERDDDNESERRELPRAPLAEDAHHEQGIDLHDSPFCER
jgi:hypothetical protein